MADFILSLLLLVSVQFGHAAYYGPQIFERTVSIRQANQSWKYPLPPELPPVVGFVAVPECERIGGFMWLFHESEGWSGPYLVADCANQLEGHDKQMRRKDIIVETDYNTALRWQVIGMGPESIHVAVVRLGHDEAD